MRLQSDPWQGIASLLIASLLALGGCSSVPQVTPPVADSSAKRQAGSPSTGKGSPALPRAGSGRGGYYQDDGPGDQIPDGLYDTPDAEPKVEPYLPRANRPYTVFGKTYKPITDARPFRQRGLGSWYGKKFHGQKTSSGELYDMFKMTAAHPTLPIPSYARVTSIATGNQVIVRINDRGPFHSSRIIDLSYTAALKLGYLAKGSSELEVERLLPDEIARINSDKQARIEQAQASASTPAPVSAPVTDALPWNGNIQTAAGAATDTGMVNTGLVSAVVGGPEALTVSSKVVAAPTGFYLQLGAYGQAANAEAVRSRLAQNWGSALPPLQVVQNGALYRIYGGPFVNRSDADIAAQQLQAAGAAKPVIVQR